MALLRCASGSSGGGGALSPILADGSQVTRTSGTMKTYTIDSSKDYILICCLRIADTTYRTNSFYIHNNTLEELDNPASSTALTVSISGNTLTVSGQNSNSYNNDLTLIQLN